MPNNFNKYKDPTGEYTNRQLKLSEWYLKHKILLSRIGTGFLVSWCVVTIGFSLWKWGQYLFFGLSADNRMHARQIAEFTNYDALHPLYGASDLQVNNVRVFKSGPDQYDFYANIKNANERWHATLTFHFEFGGEETPAETTVLLPQVERPVVFYGHNTKQFPRNARFVIDEIDWWRINPHVLPNVSAYINERQQFDLSDFSFTRGTLGSSVPEINFTVTNRSAYSFWSPGFNVELLNNRVLVGLVFLNLPEFRAGESREVSLRYFGDALNVSDIRLHPAVDVFDKNEFIEPGS